MAIQAICGAAAMNGMKPSVRKPDYVGTAIRHMVKRWRYMHNKLTILWLRAKGCSVEWTALVHPDAVLERSGGEITIGPRTSIDKGAILRAMGGAITLGADCSVNAYSFLSGGGGLHIADSVMIASHVSIYASNHVFADIAVPMRVQGLTSLGIVIREDVWIGTGARIVDGVEVGMGSVIAAGAVVTKSTEPLTINGGVPARVIGNRKSTG